MAEIINMFDKIEMLEYENKYYSKGCKYIAGVDEVGRGPLAGPVVAAAVVFKKDFYMPQINDSKKLSEKKREQLFDIIKENALSYSIAFVDEKEIDELNILNATLKAFEKAVNGLEVVPDITLIDGNRCGDFPTPVETIVKGDSKSMSIAAASILAKVARDRYMTELDALYPMYNFKKNKGYPTAEHTQAIIKYGPSPVHRLTFKRVREYVR